MKNSLFKNVLKPNYVFVYTQMPLHITFKTVLYFASLQCIACS